MAKLTLSVDEEVVEQAKRYAARRGTSVSHLVEVYLALLSRVGPEPETEIAPILSRLRGVLRDGDRSTYRRYLERKYR